MYQNFSTFEAAAACNQAMFDRDAPLTAATPVAGAEDVEIAPAAMGGLWTLRFGRFGCAENETRGGVVHLQGDGLMGGDDNFAYQGRWTLRGSELTASLDVIRHGLHNDVPTIFGTVERAYRLDCVAEAITADLFEGRLRRPGHADARFVMRRLPVTDGSHH